MSTMNLDDMIKAYEEDGSHRVELIVRNQKGLGYLINLISQTPGGWAGVKESNIPGVEEAERLGKLILGEMNFKYFIITQNILKSIK